MANHLITLFFFSLLLQLIYAEYRTLNGTNNNLNNPILSTTLVRKNPPISFYSVINVNSSALIPTPGNYTSSVPADFVNCSASINLPRDSYPLPRCVSNLVGSLRTNVDDVYKLDTLEKFKSQRKTSHIATFFGFFLVADVVLGNFGGDGYPTGIYIPQDDQLYLSKYSINPNLVINASALPFNRSASTPDSTGFNLNTPFVDGSQIYGRSLERLSQIRDYGNRGKMLLLKSNDTDDSALFGYPPKENGEYVFGHVARKGRNIFTDVFYVIFLREHNRRCDQLWDIHGDSWSDEMYFQESRKWVIALLQRVTFYEYLGIVLGSPLPPYKGYDPNLEPSIDTFFSTVTYRYGHSELSDYYNIVNKNGNVLASLPLISLQEPYLLETYGVPFVALSLALQRQEENDIYFADTVRKFPARYQNQVEELDLMSLDVIRSRDHAIPLYNDAREAMGLKRAIKWSDITDNTEVQQRLIDAYEDINKVEAIFGGLAETHINGSNFGELFYTSFYDQMMKIRDSDRFWYESDVSGLTQEERYEINNTTLSQIIARNIPDTFKLPSNIWIVQPPISLNYPGTNANDNNNPNDNNPSLLDYPPSNHIKLSDIYEVYWKIVDNEIYFKLIIASTNAWFAIGFNDRDSMITSDIVIFRNTNNDIEAKQYGTDGYYTPKLLSEQNPLVKVRSTEIKSYSLVEFSRPLRDEGSTLKTIAENKKISMIYAWNPNSNIITYHAGNRGYIKMDFFSYTYIDSMKDIRRKNLLFHGIVMFLVWSILYPISIWRVRYRKTKGSYVKNHKNLQILGAFFVSIFGGIALALLGGNSIRTVHGKIGMSIICMMSIQIGLGLFDMWSLRNVESVNMGIIKLLRYIHRIFGFMLLILSWVNTYLGINEYTKQFSTVKSWSIVYIVWMVLLALVFIISENIFRIRDIRFRYPKDNNTIITRDGKLAQQLRYFIEDYDQLPVISLNEFNQRVISGVKLVLVENMVFDISKWIEYHPGGAKILQRVVGTDITHDFFGSNSSNNKFKFKFDEDEPYMTDNEKEGENQVITKRNNTKNDDIGETFANLIDVININKTLGKKSSRVSVHSHSRYATEKLATMAVAKLPDEYDEDDKNINITGYSKPPPVPPRPHYTSQYNQPSSQVDLPNLSSPSIFRRCIITNIEIVTDNVQFDSLIVKKFTLKPVHKGDSFPYRRFYPGDYIEIMCDINQQRVIRQYSPLSEEFSEDCQDDQKSASSIEVDKTNKKIFWILVKIYKDGLMSRYLDKQLKNFEILIRGPFNVSDNMIPDNQSLSISDCILLNPNKPNGCWDNLFMICGGSGITPMLQLIHYHLQYQQQKSSANTFHLYLLFANNSYSDIIHQRHLKYLEKKFMGKLTITHILVNPPNNWNDLKGYIDDAILLNWLSSNINININGINTPTVPTQVVYYPQQQQFATGSFDGYDTPLIMPYSPGEQRRLYSAQDSLIESFSASSSSIIDKFPDNSKIIVCGNGIFMLSIQNICNRIGIKEKDILFLL